MIVWHHLNTWPMQIELHEGASIFFNVWFAEWIIFLNFSQVMKGIHFWALLLVEWVWIKEKKLRNRKSVCVCVCWVWFSEVSWHFCEDLIPPPCKAPTLINPNFSAFSIACHTRVWAALLAVMVTAVGWRRRYWCSSRSVRSPPSVCVCVCVL